MTEIAAKYRVQSVEQKTVANSQKGVTLPARVWSDFEQVCCFLGRSLENPDGSSYPVTSYAASVLIDHWRSREFNDLLRRAKSSEPSND